MDVAHKKAERDAAMAKRKAEREAAAGATGTGRPGRGLAAGLPERDPYDYKTRLTDMEAVLAKIVGANSSESEGGATAEGALKGLEGEEDDERAAALRIDINPSSAWVGILDEHGDEFYHNRQTGEASWEPPAEGVSASEATTRELLAVPLPSTPAAAAASAALGTIAGGGGGGAALSEAYGGVVSEEVRYNPGSLWVGCMDDEEDMFFLNTVTGETSWTLPEEGVSGVAPPQ